MHYDRNAVRAYPMVTTWLLLWLPGAPGTGRSDDRAFSHQEQWLAGGRVSPWIKTRAVTFRDIWRYIAWKPLRRIVTSEAGAHTCDSQLGTRFVTTRKKTGRALAVSGPP